MLALATRVVSDYGKVLARVSPGVYGLPESLLPYPKARIRMALQYLLQHVAEEHPELREGLARGYVYLAQFVADDQAEIIARGTATASGVGADEGDAEPAMRLINGIKAEMERALDELAGVVPVAS
ncbi:hypothetical protein [Tahibacter amnicola]|uniref:Uncharacterized protein n=1 Tax=Tahibacter amnicola TaxID=2976241 RepID=A0ABY6BD99_9GAMM|nr:hypothetical protein [Tahibacter amnicola]UXI67198.1 hypothetical protein N4264_21030 [Tahibacter amnicola]